jgi:DNA-directed RNA polymerase subunit RPC12/RpoP
LEIYQPIDIKPGELRCPRCRGRDIVPSLPRGFKDAFMYQFSRIPRHCRSCGRRFYVRDLSRREDVDDESSELS